MATLNVQSIDEDGLEASFSNAAGGGDVFLNDGRTFIEIVNGGETDMTVTPQVQKPSVRSAGYGELTKPEVAITVTAGERRHVGPFPQEAYNNASGQVELVYSAVTTVTIAALRLPIAG